MRVSPREKMGLYSSLPPIINVPMKAVSNSLGKLSLGLRWFSNDMLAPEVEVFPKEFHIVMLRLFPPINNAHMPVDPGTVYCNCSTGN